MHKTRASFLTGITFLYISKRKANYNKRKTLTSQKLVFKKILDTFIKIALYVNFFVQLSLLRKCRCSEFFSSIFFHSGLNMDTYSESLCIYLECGKMPTRKILNTDTFKVVCLSKKSFNEKSTLNAQFRSSTAGIYLFKVNN